MNDSESEANGFAFFICNILAKVEVCYKLAINRKMLDNLKPIDAYFLKHEEPIKSCLQFLRGYILAHNNSITETWKYGVPFYCFNGKRFCYLWVDKKRKQPYIGIVNGYLINHSNLLAENRSRMKIMLIDANEDMPVEIIDEVLNAAIASV